jgi:hypothetical protein
VYPKLKRAISGRSTDTPCREALGEYGVGVYLKDLASLITIHSADAVRRAPERRIEPPTVSLTFCERYGRRSEKADKRAP